MRPSKYFSEQFGFSFIEGLVASGLLVLAALALGYGVAATTRGREKALVVSDSMAVDSMVVSALQNANSFVAYVDMLKLGDIDQFKANFRLDTPGWGAGFVRVGSTKFRRDHSLCTGCSDWVYNVVLDVEMLSAPPNVRYGFAYAVIANSQMAAMAGLGSQPDATGLHFPLADYKLIIPESLLSETLRCASDEIAAYGLDLQTADLKCWKGPQFPNDACPSGTIPVGLQVNVDRITFKCQPLFHLSCGNMYAMNGMVPTVLAQVSATPSLAGSCVFVAQQSVPARSNASTASVAEGVIGVTQIGSEFYGTFCPLGYRAIIEECTALLGPTPTSPTRCPTGYPNACPTPAMDPTVPNGAWYGAAATYDGALVRPVIPVAADRVVSGDASLITNPTDPNINKAFCRLNNPVQASGAGWSGSVRMRIRCDSAYAEFVPPTLL